MLAFISGASRGIGKAISQKLFQLNYDLILVARGQSDLEKLKHELLLQRPDAKIRILSADLSIEKQLRDICRQLSSERPDVIVNNIGNFVPDKASELKSMEALLFALQLNLFASVQITNCFLPKMREVKKGFIFNVCSVASLNALKEAASYSISKAALKSWNDALRKELSKDEIKVTAVYPAEVNTSSWAEDTPNKDKMLQPQDIANVLEMCLGLSTYSNCDEIHLSPMHV